jgi:hypothetical protein
MFKSKREKELEELIALYKGKIEALENASPAAKYVAVQVPQASDMTAYWTKVAAFSTDPLYVFYLSQLRREIVDRFETMGDGKAEYYRGMLAAVGQMFNDARKSIEQLAGVSREV